MEEKVLMEKMSWVEIKEALEKGKTTVLVISGSIEQHGPHLPTGTDTILGYEIGKRAAQRLGYALVAPVVRPALSEHHTGFPGSFTLTWETYKDVLEDYCDSLARYGFKDIVLMSSHGGNNAVLKAITPDLAKKLYGRVNVHLVLHHERGMAQAIAFLKEKGISVEKAGVHSGYGETCEMLVAKPHLVKMKFAEKGQVDEALYRPENLPRFQIDSFIHGVKHFSENGVLGDPRGANEETGKELIDLGVKVICEEINRAVGKN
ncbi:MAG: creatininase family protein [Deltaproteobacteria bacterium]|nr:creatininase family protein [Deltaproteobacteria bacterium]